MGKSENLEFFHILRIVDAQQKMGFSEPLTNIFL